jgi:hypothetical protein
MLEMFRELQFMEAIVILGKWAILKIKSEPSRKALHVVLTEMQPKLLGLALLASKGGVARFARGGGGGAGGLTDSAAEDTLPSRICIVLHEVRQWGKITV